MRAVTSRRSSDYLFSSAPLEKFRGFQSASHYASKTLFAFDFDGTLTGIVSRPEQVSMRDVTIELLTNLERRAPVAIISGRSKASLRQVVPTHPKYFIGNHGFESAGVDRRVLNAAARACAGWLGELEMFLQAMAGIHIEDKKYTLSVHYRLVKGAARPQAKNRILAMCRTLVPLPRMVLGKCVVNLLPPVGLDKGKALLALMKLKGFERAIYVGDDDTDEDVFTLPEARGRSPRILTVRIGKKAGSRARFYIRRQTEIDRLLSEMTQLASPSSRVLR